MTETPRIAYWRGEPITEMSREELIEALTELGTLYDQQLRSSIETHDFYRGVMQRRAAR